MRLLTTLTALAITLGMFARTNDPIVIPLWPDGAPTANGLEGTPEVFKKRCYSNVSEPSLTVYPAPNPDGRVIICCPGGAYALLAWGHEGIDMADWMNTMGITLAVLKYRMPNGHPTVPLEDSRRAIELVREHAADWGADPAKVGIMGSSAGGHFAATLATLHGDKDHRPDFQILLYPVISMQDGVTHSYSRQCLLGENPTPELVEHYTLENRVDADTPPAFIALSADDRTVSPLNTLNYCEALTRNKIPYALHVYPTGEHGWGYRDTFPYKPLWTAELASWLSTFK